MKKFSKDPDAISRLSPEQYRVTQQNGTETPGTGEYLDNKQPGIYVDIVSGEPLFASTDKFESALAGRASPSPLSRPMSTRQRDTTHGMTRTEVRSRMGTAILGMSFPTARATAADYATASTPPRYGSSIGMIWRAEGYGTTANFRTQVEE